MGHQAIAEKIVAAHPEASVALTGDEARLLRQMSPSLHAAVTPGRDQRPAADASAETPADQLPAGGGTHWLTHQTIEELRLLLG